MRKPTTPPTRNPSTPPKPTNKAREQTGPQGIQLRAFQPLTPESLSGWIDLLHLRHQFGRLEAALGFTPEQQLEVMSHLWEAARRWGSDNFWRLMFTSMADHQKRIEEVTAALRTTLAMWKSYEQERAEKTNRPIEEGGWAIPPDELLHAMAPDLSRAYGKMFDPQAKIYRVKFSRGQPRHGGRGWDRYTVRRHLLRLLRRMLRTSGLDRADLKRYTPELEAITDSIVGQLSTVMVL